MTIVFDPIVFGCFSTELKRAVDRIISPLLRPFMAVRRGETHHLPRYSRYPRLVGVGIQRRPDLEEEAIFRLLVGRNALNLHAPSYAAEVVHSDMEAEILLQRFQAMLEREDVFPLPKTIKAFGTALKPDPGFIDTDNERNALLILGSPKAKPSMSSALGTHLQRGLEQRGWETETLKLKANLRGEKGQAELLVAVDRAGLILLAFPLYNDAPPVFVLKAFQVIAAHRKEMHLSHPQRLAVIINNGFPEAHQNIPAIAICRKFAQECGFGWAGGLALGAGEAFNDGQPLTERKSLPSARHILLALDLAAGALAEGRTVPEGAAALFARTPVPFSPFSVWRRIFILKAARRWQREAAENGLGKAQM